MIAEVYPALTLPRHLSYFDYRIPDNLQVECGDLVSILFSGRHSLGVVKRVKSDDQCEVPSPGHIHDLRWKGYFSQHEITRFEFIARTQYCSVSSLITHGVIEPKSLAQHSSTHSQPHAQKTSVNFIKNLNFHALPDTITCSVDAELTLAYACITKAFKTLILVPSRAHGKLFEERLGMRSRFLHAKKKDSEQSSIIALWQRGDIDALIVTPRFVSAPFAKATHLLMTDAASELYEVQKRHPHTDARHIMHARANASSLTFIQTSRVSSLSRGTGEQQPATAPIFISPRGEKHQIRGFSNALLDIIEQASAQGRPIIVIHNKKGHAAGLICRSCGKTPTCVCGVMPSLRKEDLICQSCGTEMWIPTSCPYCHAKELTERGIGIETLKKKLHQKFPQAELQVGTVSELSTVPKQSILIVTNFDQHLTSLDYRNQLLTANRLWNYMYVSYDRQAKLYIQTMQSDLLTQMLDQKRFIKNEREMRQKYGLPPYTQIIRIVDKDHTIDYDKLLVEAQNANITTLRIDAEQIELRGTEEAFQVLQPHLIKLSIRTRLLSAFTL
ncbi:MAG: hypothetical protein O3B64_00065 [bacterium]|nr:hypothetical protein [bacterium]MDA1024519.1 hypothetical protein [bacterium]